MYFSCAVPPVDETTRLEGDQGREERLHQGRQNSSSKHELSEREKRPFPRHGAPASPTEARRQKRKTAERIPRYPCPQVTASYHLSHLEAVHLHALGQQLLDPRRADVPQAVVRVVDEPLAERAQPQSHHHPVVEDLCRDVRLADVVLQVAHQQEVPGRVEAVVERVVRDVAEHGARAAAVVAVLVHGHAQILELLRVVRLCSSSGSAGSQEGAAKRSVIGEGVQGSGVCPESMSSGGDERNGRQDRRKKKRMQAK